MVDTKKRNYVTTTISVSRKNHMFLTELGKKGQSFDEILSELLTSKLNLSSDSQQKNNDGRGIN